MTNRIRAGHVTAGLAAVVLWAIGLWQFYVSMPVQMAKGYPPGNIGLEFIVVIFAGIVTLMLMESGMKDHANGHSKADDALRKHGLRYMAGGLAICAVTMTLTTWIL